jgi:hypothetical protein
MNDKEFKARLGNPPSLANAKKQFERELFETALRQARKSPSKAAQLLGLSYQTFIRRLTKHEGLERTPIKKRYHSFPTEDYYVIIKNVGPTPLNVAKVISEYIPDQANQKALLQKLASQDQVTFKAPSKGRANHIIKLLRKHKAVATLETIPITKPKNQRAVTPR